MLGDAKEPIADDRRKARSLGKLRPRLEAAGDRGLFGGRQRGRVASQDVRGNVDLSQVGKAGGLAAELSFGPGEAETDRGCQRIRTGCLRTLVEPGRCASRPSSRGSPRSRMSSASAGSVTAGSAC